MQPRAHPCASFSLATATCLSLLHTKDNQSSRTTRDHTKSSCRDRTYPLPHISHQSYQKEETYGKEQYLTHRLLRKSKYLATPERLFNNFLQACYSLIYTPIIIQSNQREERSDSTAIYLLIRITVSVKPTCYDVSEVSRILHICGFSRTGMVTAMNQS